MREDSEGRSVWRAQSKRWRAFAHIWLPFTLILLLIAFLVSDVHWGTRVSAVCNVLAGLSFIVTARIGTTADAQGLHVAHVWTRHIPWAAVADFCTNPPGRWAADVQAALTDGQTITLPAVPVSDLPCLNALRSGR